MHSYIPEYITHVMAIWAFRSKNPVHVAKKSPLIPKIPVELNSKPFVIAYVLI
jgi:hypothetical protein